MERRALYNSLRMNWLMDPKLPVEPWQVEDYRSIALEELFRRLHGFGLMLDRISFTALAESVDSPEEFTDSLVADQELDNQTQDKIYLLIFELWRRLISDKPGLSLFCDELDHQIYLHDLKGTATEEGIQDALSNLEVILAENTDNGGDPVEVFASIAAGCANDIENFLYDYIAEQIDLRDYPYASELLDDFYNYVDEAKWFDFLKARLTAKTDPASGAEMITALIADVQSEPDLDFNLAVLSFLVEEGDEKLFCELVKKTTLLLEVEEDFQDLVTICADYYHRLDNDAKEAEIQEIVKKREGVALDKPVGAKDLHVQQLITVLTSKR